MYQIKYAPEFIVSARRCKRMGKNMNELWQVVRMLQQDGCVPASYKPHMLHDEWEGCMECHIEEDWLLIWQQNDRKMTLLLLNVGTHKQLFTKL